jgi:hypothetical protein
MGTTPDAQTAPLPPATAGKPTVTYRRAWTLLAIGAVLAAVWAGSAWRGMDFATGDVRLWVERGVVRLVRGGPVIRTRVSVSVVEEAPSIDWWLRGPGGFGVASFKPSFFGYEYGWLACVSLWPPALACVVLGARSMWVQRRRLRAGCCTKCGYPVGGAARCPECGLERRLNDAP